MASQSSSRFPVRPSRRAASSGTQPLAQGAYEHLMQRLLEGELAPGDPFSFTALSVACMRGGRIAEAEEALARSRMLQAGG